MTNQSPRDPSLRSLRDKPVALLQELERRVNAVAGLRQDTEESSWTGISFRMGPETFLTPRDEVREVLAWPTHVARIPGAKTWVRGLANVRGLLVPIIDIRQYLGSASTTATRQSRVLLVSHRDLVAGFMVDEVAGFARCARADYQEVSPPPAVRCDRFLMGAYRFSGTLCPVLSFRKIIETPNFLQAAA
jgi:twitching motility protein PilI